MLPTDPTPQAVLRVLHAHRAGGGLSAVQIYDQAPDIDRLHQVGAAIGLLVRLGQIVAIPTPVDAESPDQTPTSYYRIRGAK